MSQDVISKPKTKIVTTVTLMTFLVSIAALYSYTRIDQVQKNTELINKIHVPLLKQLNQVSGKWAAYLRSFEQQVAFKKWGEDESKKQSNKLVLKRMLDGNIEVLLSLSSGLEYLDQNLKVKLDELISKLETQASLDPVTMAELSSFIKLKKFPDAAQIYTQTRQQHGFITQSLILLSADVESRLTQAQYATENELRKVQGIFFFWLMASLVISLAALLKLRKWFKPVQTLTDVAKEIAIKGVHSGVRYPEIKPNMPEELALLTREFSRMARTVLEREFTINQQKTKLESLNEKLKEQNSKLLRLIDAEEKLQHAKKLIMAGNFSSQVAHEVRNPLNAMSLQFDMLSEDIEEATQGDIKIKIMTRLNEIISQIERLERITDNYLAVSKPRKSTVVNFDLSELLDECLSFLSQEIEKARIRVELKCKDGVRVAACPDSVSQVIFNLVRNAIEAINDKKVPYPRITIEVGIREKKAYLNITDNAGGIAPEFQERVFEPFTTTKVSGHGLGLSISKQICNENGGELRLLSAQMAKFEFTLPANTEKINRGINA